MWRCACRAVCAASRPKRIVRQMVEITKGNVRQRVQTCGRYETCSCTARAVAVLATITVVRQRQHVNQMDTQTNQPAGGGTSAEQMSPQRRCSVGQCACPAPNAWQCNHAVQVNVTRTPTVNKQPRIKHNGNNVNNKYGNHIQVA